MSHFAASEINDLYAEHHTILQMSELLLLNHPIGYTFLKLFVNPTQDCG